MKSRIDYLRSVSLLRGLDDDELERIAARSREEVFMPQTPIMEIGEAGSSLYIILDGTVQVLYPGGSGDFELARLGAGEVFGEMALLTDRPRSATVKSVKPVRALVLDREDFRAIVEESPGLALRVLEVLSARIRTADERIGEMDREILRDSLTGLLNRRAFHERLEAEADRTRRYGDRFSLIMLDLDHFKRINDTLGHDVGDRLLTWVGGILADETRTADTPFRIGGEEFAILAPSTPGEMARRVAQRLLDALAGTEPPLSADVKVTASAGYAACPEDASDPEALFRVADQALLRAKDEGRARVATPAGA